MPFQSKPAEVPPLPHGSQWRTRTRNNVVFGSIHTMDMVALSIIKEKPMNQYHGHICLPSFPRFFQRRIKVIGPTETKDPDLYGK